MLIRMVLSYEIYNRWAYDMVHYHSVYITLVSLTKWMYLSLTTPRTNTAIH